LFPSKEAAHKRQGAVGLLLGISFAFLLGSLFAFLRALRALPSASSALHLFAFDVHSSPASRWDSVPLCQILCLPKQSHPARPASSDPLTCHSQS
jgi:hypothetical protein